LAASIVALAVIREIFLWARRRRALALEAEAPVAVPVALRRVAAGLRGRWRQGVVVHTEENALFWRPRKPRLGASISLSGAIVLEVRKRTRAEWGWISFLEDVLIVQSSSGSIEVAVHPAERVALETLLAKASAVS